ncbi:MAG TPA: ferritin [Kiritimatiellae bacterium]|nr:ferritin [Kiritimatiellia bacterium]
MGTHAREILGMDPTRLIEELNKAFADEWLAYYQYWLGARVVTGPMRGAVEAELNEHAADELRHAEMVAQRILQLGGEPLLSPDQWHSATNCGYDAPSDPEVSVILEQNVKGERCAIDTYLRMLKLVEGKDPVTYNMVLSILQDEIEHEDDLESLLRDLEQRREE